MERLALVLVCGCVVVDPVEVNDEPNFPPSIVVSDQAVRDGLVQNRIVTIDTSDPSLGAEVVFSVDVRDPNLEQVLKAQVWLDFSGRIDDLVPQGTDGPVGRDLIRPTGGLVRNWEFRVPIDRLTAGGVPSCHRIELAVSSEFGFFDDPVDPDDIDRDVWWLRVIDSAAGAEALDLAECG